MLGFLTLRDKKAKTVLHGFVEIVNESKRKASKWVDQAGGFYESSMQKWIDNNCILWYTRVKSIKIWQLMTINLMKVL